MSGVMGGVPAGVAAASGVDAEVPVDVAVIGGGVAGLVAARECALAGRSVVVLEAAAALGGLVGRVRLADVDLDNGAEGFATRGGTVAALLAEIGLGDQLVEPTGAAARIYADGRRFALPATGVLGIPTDLDEPGLHGALGAAGWERARLDRDLPASVGADEVSLAGLVRARMGEAVVERLLRPVVQGVHSVDPEEIDADALVPRLRARLAQWGSLAAALADVRTLAPAGAAVQGVAGGMYRVVEALREDLERRGAHVVPRCAVQAIRRQRGGWSVLAAPAGALAERRFSAQRVVLACAPHTWSFLPGDDPTVAALVDQAAAWPAPSQVEIVSLLLRTNGRTHLRSGALVARPAAGQPAAGKAAAGVAAKALTYSSAKWAWLAQACGPDREAVRMSYPVTHPAMPAVSAAQALADLNALLGLGSGEPLPAAGPAGGSGAPFEPEDVIELARTRWTMPRPVLAHEMSERVAAICASKERMGRGGLELTGSWLAGTGLANVISHARTAGVAARTLASDGPSR